MSFQIPTGIRDPFQLMPAGCIPLVGKGYRIEHLGKDDQGNPKNLFTIIISSVTSGLGGAWDGISHDEYFVIGDEGNESKGIKADPGAADPATWVRRAGNLKQYIQDGMGLQFEGADLLQVLAAIPGRTVLATVVHVPEPAMKNNRPNQYAGRVRANVTKWAKEGSVTPFVDEQGMTRAQDQASLLKPGMGTAPGMPPPPPLPTGGPPILPGGPTVGQTPPAAPTMPGPAPAIPSPTPSTVPSPPIPSAPTGFPPQPPGAPTAPVMPGAPPAA